MTQKIQDVFGAAPKTVLNKPFMHVQDQKPNGTAGDAVSIGDNGRDLTTVLVNNIPGSSLGTNTVTLPAGKYYVECSAVGYSATISYLRMYLRDTVGTTILSSNSERVEGDSNSVGFNGEVTLNTVTTLEVVDWRQLASASGKGAPTSSGDVEVYADLRIWQLDSTIETPVLLDNKLYPLPGDSMVTGNMYGLEYAKTGDNEVTIQAGICMDSMNTEVLDLATQQTVSIPATINTIFNLFLCDDGVVRQDTDVDGASLAYRVRWIGFVLTDASGDIESFTMTQNSMQFHGPLFLLVSTSNVSWTPIDMAVYGPATRVDGIKTGVRSTSTSAQLMYYSYDTSATFDARTAGSSAEVIRSQSGYLDFANNGLYVHRSGSTNVNLYLTALRLKR